MRYKMFHNPQHPTEQVYAKLRHVLKRFLQGFRTTNTTGMLQQLSFIQAPYPQTMMELCVDRVEKQN